MLEINLFMVISSLCNFGGGAVTETIKCQKYYIWCLREQVEQKKTKGYQEGMLEVCVANMVLIPSEKKKASEVEG